MQASDPQTYKTIAPSIQAGDIIAFQGTRPISFLIDLFSGSKVSHVGIVRQPVAGMADVLLGESTIENGVSGPQHHPLSEVLTGQYPSGRAWWLPLRADIRELIDWKKFYAFIGSAEGSVKYDVAGLFGFLARSVPVLGAYVCQQEDPRQMFCDAYCIAVLESCGVLRGINYRKATPQDLCEMQLYRECVQIWGKPAQIRNFNTV